MAVSRPDWYQSGDIAETIIRAVEESEPTDRIVKVLCDHEVEAPIEQVRQLVATTRSRVEAGEAGTDTSRSGESVTVDSDAKELAAGTTDRPVLSGRAIRLGDLDYLGSRDAALVVGAVLSRYEGTFVVPDEVDDLAVDLLWNRQHSTIGLRVISRPQRPVSEAVVDQLKTGSVTPAAGRSPSVLGIVANVPFSDTAQAAAGDDIELFGPIQLRTWLSEARLPRDVFGELVEAGELSRDERAELLADVPTVPPTVRESDPLTVAGNLDTVPADSIAAGTTNASGSETTSTAEGGAGDSSSETPPAPTAGGVDERMPVAEDPATPGTLGELYADPAEDGDFGAFDRYLNGLDSDDEAASDAAGGDQ